jgi:precorrin-3B C17-methyltransferase
VIVGYKTYIDLVDPHVLQGKTIVSTGMTREVDRCQKAIDHALAGDRTALVSSGDAGIYGMAGLVYELLEKRGCLDQMEVEVVPGIPALAAAAALLGAPLMHDFAVVSLSDLLTPWPVIRSRIEAAAKADFSIVIYNPRSKKRDWQLGEALGLIRQHRRENTPVGVVRNAMRRDQSVLVTTISDLDTARVDMLTILVVGNSQTKTVRDKMITPRGYMEKYEDKAQGAGYESQVNGKKD